ncbi:ATP-dependent DNA ligase [Streptomyces sp. NBC_01207]|uniref:ATP-dependent DNA ligase n=1 Tax=Streptomyces sp. NBC_01207 TaxID=2903772 RepID=UPI003FA3CDA3
MAHPDPNLGDVRGRPYTERRRLMLELLEHVPPPIQAVPATDDRETALIWFEVLQQQGIEGIVAKGASSTYRGGQRLWEKVRHSETVDAPVPASPASPASRASPELRPAPATSSSGFLTDASRVSTADSAAFRAGRSLPSGNRPGRRSPYA